MARRYSDFGRVKIRRVGICILVLIFKLARNTVTCNPKDNHQGSFHLSEILTFYVRFDRAYGYV